MRIFSKSSSKKSELEEKLENLTSEVENLRLKYDQLERQYNILQRDKNIETRQELSNKIYNADMFDPIIYLPNKKAVEMLVNDLEEYDEKWNTLEIYNLILEEAEKYAKKTGIHEEYLLVPLSRAAYESLTYFSKAFYSSNLIRLSKEKLNGDHVFYKKEISDIIQKTFDENHVDKIVSQVYTKDKIGDELEGILEGLAKMESGFRYLINGKKFGIFYNFIHTPLSHYEFVKEDKIKEVLENSVSNYKSDLLRETLDEAERFKQEETDKRFNIAPIYSWKILMDIMYNVINSEYLDEEGKTFEEIYKG